MSHKVTKPATATSDDSLFRQAVADVKPLSQHDTAMHHTPKPEAMLTKLHENSNEMHNKDDKDGQSTPTDNSTFEAEWAKHLAGESVLDDEAQVDSDALFLQAMNKVGVKPLKQPDQVLSDAPKPKPIPNQFLEDEKQVMIDMMSDDYDPAEIQPGAMLSFRREGVQRGTFKKLRSGHYSITDELDLHGMTSIEARVELNQFLLEVEQLKGCCVRIIHGKGRRSNNKGPVLKRKVDDWLRHHDRVLAFHSALPVDGGTGAIYLLLRRL